jgi:hypothetical protein
MTTYITKKMDSKELERVLLEVSYSGERYLIQRTDGVSFAIVPSEDLQVLEEVDRNSQ